MKKQNVHFYKYVLACVLAMVVLTTNQRVESKILLPHEVNKLLSYKEINKLGEIPPKNRVLESKCHSKNKEKRKVSTHSFPLLFTF